MSHSYVLQTLEDIETKANKGIAGIFPDVKCGDQHGDATRMEELNVGVDWNNHLVRIQVVDVCVFCEKPVGLPYILNARIDD